MSKFVRTGVLGGLLACLLLFAAPFSGAQRLAYAVDQRPERTILFIGNSRTSWHDMPSMLRSTADSAGHDTKLRTEMHAPDGDGLSDHWSNERVRSLLWQHWDHVVLQAQSTEQIDKRSWGKWLRPAAEMITAARKSEASPTMFVTWRYTEQCPEDLSWNATSSAAMHTAIQQQHTWLAQTEGVDLVNVGLVWERVMQNKPDFSLYADCNHPSVYGSYLSALMFFGKMLDGDVAAVTFRPSGIEEHQAEFLRTAVVRYLHETAGGRSNQPGGQVAASTTDGSSVDPAEQAIPAKCMWGIFAQAQAVRAHCPSNPAPLDDAIDKALPEIEAHLIAAGELDRDAPGYYQRMYADDPGGAAQMCQTIEEMRAHISAQYVEQMTSIILAAGPDQFSDDCI